MKIISFLSTPAPHFHIYNFFSVAVACHKFIHIFLKDAKANEPIWEIKLKLNFEARQWERVWERERDWGDEWPFSKDSFTIKLAPKK